MLPIDNAANPLARCILYLPSRVVRPVFKNSTYRAPCSDSFGRSQKEGKMKGFVFLFVQFSICTDSKRGCKSSQILASVCRLDCATVL